MGPRYLTSLWHHVTEIVGNNWKGFMARSTKHGQSKFRTQIEVGACIEIFYQGHLEVLPGPVRFYQGPGVATPLLGR